MGGIFGRGWDVCSFKFDSVRSKGVFSEVEGGRVSEVRVSGGEESGDGWRAGGQSAAGEAG